MQKFLAQLIKAVNIQRKKVGGIVGCLTIIVAMAENALNVRKMNVNPGGEQKILRDNGQTQKMYFMQSGKKVAKGLRLVLEERGIDKNGGWMREVLSLERSEIEKYLIKKGHIPTFLPKFLIL